MYHFNAENLSQKQNYKFLTGSVIPRPIAWVTSENENGSTNLAPFSFFQVIASELPLVMLSVNHKGTIQKDTGRNILRTKEAVIHLVSEDDLIDMNQTAANLPPEESELSLTDQKLLTSQTVRVKSLAKPKIRLETKLFQYVPIKHDQRIINDLLILQVSDYFFAEEIFDPDKEYIDPSALNPMARLAGNNYARIFDIQTLIRPK